MEGTDKIGVLVAEGEIVGTKGGDDNIGSDDFVKELRKLRDNKSVKAIVLRIDSPGGSSLASDVMWREIELAKSKTHRGIYVGLCGFGWILHGYGC